ncbi:MAG: M15 family metallopeptidase, partial [Acidimicrobiia bacterium]
MIRRRIAAGWAMLAILASVMPVVPVVASDTGVSQVNFSESAGCEPGVAGFTRPNVGRSGPMTVNEQIRGPWGDMFGRSYYQVAQSLTNWQLPGSNKTMRVHSRMLPALQEVETNLNGHLAQGKSYYVYSAVAYVWRTVGGSTRPSEHAIGTAFDINPASNPYSRDNYLRTNMPDWYVDSFVDAGFCWGGNWVNVKDAMHFSWSGPATTPGAVRHAPYPPITPSTNYGGTTLNFTSKVGASQNATITIGDVTGEGAPDIIRVSDSGKLEASSAIGDYGFVAARGTAPVVTPDAMIGDVDKDGKPDIWVAKEAGGSIELHVYTWASDYQAPTVIPTLIPSSQTNLLLGHYDDDFTPDVYAIDDAGITVYGSKTFYQQASAQIPMPAGADTSWHFTTGDHDVDGKSDVYAFSNGSPAQLSGRTAAGASFSATINDSIDADTAVDVGDYDGDGREDLFVLNGTSLTVTLGGNSYGAPDMWFQTPSTVIPDAGPECLAEPCDTIGFVDDQGIWYTAEEPSTSSEATDFYYGDPGDVPFMGDWDCDGVDTPGLYRQSDGFVYLRNSNTQGIADLQYFFGNPSDVPLAGDFNGNGCDTVSLYRPSEHRVY